MHWALLHVIAVLFQSRRPSEVRYAVTASFGTLGYEDVGAIRDDVPRLFKCLHLADKQRTDALYLVRVWLDIDERSRSMKHGT